MDTVILDSPEPTENVSGHISSYVGSLIKAMFKDRGPRKLLARCAIAACVCAGGFVADSETVVIGSMLLSPIGLELVKLKNATGPDAFDPTVLAAMVAICVGVGVMAGAVVRHYYYPDDAPENAVSSRGHTMEVRDFIISGVIAFGASLYVATKDDVASVGIGISTALLPPLVAAGYYTYQIIARALRWDGENRGHSYTFGSVGFAMLNFCINAFAMGTFAFAHGKIRRTG